MSERRWGFLYGLGAGLLAPAVWSPFAPEFEWIVPPGVPALIWMFIAMITVWCVMRGVLPEEDDPTP